MKMETALGSSQSSGKNVYSIKKCFVMNQYVVFAIRILFEALGKTELLVCDLAKQSYNSLINIDNIADGRAGTLIGIYEQIIVYEKGQQFVDGCLSVDSEVD